jgi:hypothetical protein
MIYTTRLLSNHNTVCVSIHYAVQKEYHHPEPLNIRVHFKLNAARRHLDNLIRLEDRAGSLASAKVRIKAEEDIDECLYHLIGVKDALLQEINSKLNLGLAQRDVNLVAINKELGKRGANARDITREIDDMLSNEHNPLWLVNELHNHSKHRNLIGQAIVIENGRPARASLIDPRSGEEMRAANDGTRILATFYLEDSYTGIEDLQRTEREKIREHFNSHNSTGA